MQAPSARSRSSAKRRHGWALAALLVVLGLVWSSWPRDVARGDPPDLARQAIPQPEATRFDDRQRADPVREIAVAVVDRSDQPIAGAQVCLMIAAQPTAQRCASADSQGIVEGLRLPNDERWRIGVSASGYRPATIPRLGQPEPRDALIRVMLTEGGTKLRGRIEDATGGVIEGAFVSVEDPSGASLAATRSLADGEFELWGPTGPVLIRAIAEGYAASEERLVLPSGAVVLRLAPESAIAGRVLDAESGQPIADAIVVARRSDDDSRSRSDDDRFTARSDADGHYQLVGMPPGAFALTSQSPAGYGASDGAVVLGFAERREGVDIRIHRGTSLRVEVVRIEQGDGCPAAQIRLLEEQTNHAIAAITDAHGQAQLSLPVAGVYQVEVACVGHRAVDPQQTVELSGRADEQQTLRIEVERGVSVRGRVVAESDGTPIADAVVALSSVHASSPAATTTTDPEGRFELTGLDAGDYVALASAPGWFPLETPVAISLPSDDAITIPLRSGGTLIGRVIETDGTAVLDARVLVRRHSQNGRFRGETIVDGEGRFELELPPGEYGVDVIGSAGQSLVDPALEHAVHATVTITADQRTEIELVVTDQDGRITGHVVRSDGEPIASAFVCAEPSTPPRGAVVRPRCAAQTTDVDGSFELRNLQAGRYTVTARVRGGGEASVTDVEPGADVELIVRGTGSLRGSAHYARDGSAPDLLIIEVVRTDAAVRRREVFLRSAGRWSIAGLPAGDYAIRLHASAGSGFAEAVVEADAETNVGDVTLDDRTSLSGRVVRLETGEPVPGFRVVATALDAQLRSRYVRDDARNISDANGQFVVSDPPTGRVTLHVIPQNLDARPPDLTEAHVTVTVRSGSSLDVGELAIPTRRLSPGQPSASFGFGLPRWDHVGDQAEQSARIETIEPGGPAARAGLELGDVITAIDGYDVTERHYVLKYRLIAPVGTTITLDTERAAGLAIRGE